MRDSGTCGDYRPYTALQGGRGDVSQRPVSGTPLTGAGRTFLSPKAGFGKRPLAFEHEVGGGARAVGERDARLLRPQLLVPGFDLVASRGQAADLEAPVGSRHGEERMVRDGDPGAHPRVDVALDLEHRFGLGERHL